jgi:hypothetical protein
MKRQLIPLIKKYNVLITKTLSFLCDKTNEPPILVLMVSQAGATLVWGETKQKKLISLFIIALANLK